MGFHALVQIISFIPTLNSWTCLLECVEFICFFVVSAIRKTWVIKCSNDDLRPSPDYFTFMMAVSLQTSVETVYITWVMDLSDGVLRPSPNYLTDVAAVRS